MAQRAPHRLDWFAVLGPLCRPAQSLVESGSRSTLSPFGLLLSPPPEGCSTSTRCAWRRPVLDQVQGIACRLLRLLVAFLIAFGLVRFEQSVGSSWAASSRMSGPDSADLSPGCDCSHTWPPPRAQDRGPSYATLRAHPRPTWLEGALGELSRYLT